jgi:hypothetical protein
MDDKTTAIAKLISRSSEFCDDLCALYAKSHDGFWIGNVLSNLEISVHLDEDYDNELFVPRNIVEQIVSVFGDDDDSLRQPINDAIMKIIEDYSSFSLVKGTN